MLQSMPMALVLPDNSQMSGIITHIRVSLDNRVTTVKKSEVKGRG